MIDYSKNYLHKIETQADFNEKYNGSFYHEPWVSYTEESRKVKYNKRMEDRYLTFDIISGGTIYWAAYNGNIIRTIEYSKNGGEWTEITSTTGTGTPISVDAGDKVMFRGENEKYALPNTSEHGFLYSHFTNGQGTLYNVYGNVMSMIYSSDFIANREFPSGSSTNFSGLFKDCNGMLSAGNLILPATVMHSYCYGGKLTYGINDMYDVISDCGMFMNCTRLTVVPKLPSKVMGYGCYSGMFYGCSSLVTAPELPATELEPLCYMSMFEGCSSLVNTPELPAMTVPYAGYLEMFRGCSSLVTAPELPATTLLTIGEDPTTGMGWNYASMFAECTSLVTAPSVLPAMELRQCCYTGMFYQCTSLTTAPVLPAETLVQACYGINYPHAIGHNGMFEGCTSLTYIKCLAINLGRRDTNYDYFLYNGSPTGTFVAHDSSVQWDRSEFGIPTGWTIVYEN